MKRRYISCIAAGLLIAMAFLASGCGVKINGKNYELFNSGENRENTLFDAIGPESSASQELAVKVEGTAQIKLSSNAGNIKINKANDSEIHVKAYKKVRGASEEVKKEILDNMNVLLEQENGQMQVVIKTKDDQDFWKWQASNYREYQVTLNIEVSLPASIEKVTATTGAGNISMEDVDVEISFHTGAGNIDVDNSAAKGKSKLTTGAGNVSFTGKVDEVDSFEATTGVGNVKFEVPNSTKMNLKADTGVGILSGSFVKTSDNNKFHFQGDINGGGPEVKLNTGVGNIKADEN